MATRDIIEIDESLCNGCGECVTACAEGAIAIVGGKARLISDTYCDGLGACLGHCPQGALSIVKRDSAAFDEEAVAEHLARRDATPAPVQLPLAAAGHHPSGGCPGARTRIFAPPPPSSASPGSDQEQSQLGQWPVQMHLVPPTAPFFTGADVLLAADCVAYAVAGFHRRFLQDKSLAIACPKLDAHQEVYLEKLVAMIDEAEINSLTVMVMEVPCCGSLVRLAQQACAAAKRRVPVSCLVVGIHGQIVAEQELQVA